MSPPAPLDQLLARPAAERRREYRYRFGQVVVFGLPVLALQLWGTALGGREAPLWVALFQALLTGWIMYVAAAGMLFEGVLVFARRRRLPGDLVVAGFAAGLFGVSLIQLARVLVASRPGLQPLFPPSRMHFHWAILLLGAWSALQWWRHARPQRTRPA